MSQFIIIKFWGIFTLSFDFYIISPQTSFFVVKIKFFDIAYLIIRFRSEGNVIIVILQQGQILINYV